MNERPPAGSGLVGYVIVLVGVAGFVLSCFLPYTTLDALVPADSSSSPTFSYYRLVATTPDGGTLQYVGGLLFLFGGATTVASVALAGIRHGHHERRRTPSILVAVTVAWSLSWIGLLVQASGFYGDEVGLLVHARQRRCGDRRHDRRLGLCKTRHAGGGISRWPRTADGGSSRLEAGSPCGAGSRCAQCPGITPRPLTQ